MPQQMSSGPAGAACAMMLLLNSMLMPVALLAMDNQPPVLQNPVVMARDHDWLVFYATGPALEHPTLEAGMLVNRSSAGVGNLLIGFDNTTAQEWGLAYIIDPHVEIWFSYYRSLLKFGSAYPLYHQADALDIGNADYTMFKSVLLYGERYDAHQWQLGLLLARAQFDHIELRPQAMSQGISAITADSNGWFVGAQLQYHYHGWTDHVSFGLGMDFMLMGSKPELNLVTRDDADYASGKAGYVPLTYFVQLIYDF